MRKQISTDDLNYHIALLDAKRKEDWVLLKDQIHDTFESLKPINLIKNAVHDAATSPEVKDSIISNAIGLGTGYLSRKIIFGSSRNPVKRLIGSVLQFAITNFVAKHSDTIKNAGENLLNQVSRFRKERRPVHHHNGHSEAHSEKDY